MASLAERYQPASVEKAARSLWAARGFPRPDGVLGRSNSPLVRQFEGSYSGSEGTTQVAIRAVAADVDARYLALAGRRALGTLRRVDDLVDDPVASLLRSLSVWTGGALGQPFDTGERRAGMEAILGRMAGRGLVVTRDASLRICPSCGAPRSPERIVYQQEEGDTYLVRFTLVDGTRRIQALAWVDGPWRLLGATALLVHPELPYAVARYRRKGVDELILTSRPSLARLADWLPGAEVEVVEEMPGARWSGHPYEYPLRAEFPMGSELTPPGGTVQAVPEVGDSGTGIVPLVPGHGGTDAPIAERLGITGWPLVNTRGRLGSTLVHKYEGLDLTTATEFVLRDLGDSGALFARLRVRRGVPHCSICGTPLVWAPGRSWCLEPSRLPADRLDAYRRLLPHDPPITQLEVAAWPVSDTITEPPGPGNATLLECARCDRLAPLGADPACPCGAGRRAVTRRLLPAIQGTLGAWARFDPLPAGDSTWLYLNDRRRAPSLAHQLAVMSGVPGAPADVGLTILPGGPQDALPGLVASVGADAVRAAVVHWEDPTDSAPVLVEACRQESRLLARYWALARSVLEQIDPAMLTAFTPSITGFLSDLEPEDRAILSRWERIRVAVLADYDAQAPARAYRRLARFLTNDLPDYRALVRARLAASANSATRRAALRTLHHLVRATAFLLGPVVPHTAEAIHSATTSGGTSLFESTVEALDANLLDDERIKGWDRWRSVIAALDRFRASVGLPPGTVLPSVAAVVATDEMAQALRGDRPTIERLSRVTRFEAFGPSTPWTGRRRDLEPVLSEIQKVYPHEATQIQHLLRRFPARRRVEPGSADELSVVIQGVPRKIFPSMVTYVERTPDRVIPTPWNRGELYVEMPAAGPVPTRIPPPLSTDGFGLLRRVERVLRQLPSKPGSSRPPLVIATLDPLASELRTVAIPLAIYLNVTEVRVVDDHREFPLAECEHGRSRTGVPWWVHLPGLVLVRRPVKHRPRNSGRSRVRPTRPGPETREPERDFAAPEWIAREEQIRALMQELDAVLGTPALGFSKVAGAWDAGLQSRSAYEAVAFDTLAALPGFGWTLAEALVEKLGRTPPPRPVRRGPGVPPPPASPPNETVTGPPPPPAYLEPRAPPALTPAPRVAAPVIRAREPLPTRPGPPELVRVPVPVPPPPAVLEPVSPAPTEAPAPPTPLPPSPESAPTAEIETVLPIPAAGVAEPAGGAPSGTRETTVEPGREPNEGAREALPLPSDSVVPSPGAPPSPRELEREPFATERMEEPVPPPPPSDQEITSAETGELAGATAVLEAPLEREPRGIEVAPPPLGEEPMPELPIPLANPSPPAEGPEPEPTTALPSVPSPEPELPAEPSPSLPVPLLPAAEAPTLAEPSELLGEVEPPPSSSPPSEEETPLAEIPVPAATEENVTPSAPVAEPGAPEVALESPGSPETTPSPQGIAEPLAEPEPARTGDAGSPPEPEALPLPPPPSPSPALEPRLEVAGTAPTLPEPNREPALPPVSTPLEAPAPPLPPEPMAPPSPPFTAPTVVPPRAGVEVVVALSYLPALQEFLDTTSAGHRGVAIVRESPERLRTHVGPRPVEVYWLTNLGRGLTLKPSDLDAYSAFLETAVGQDRVTAFFLEGIEYLARLHGMDRIIERLTAFHARAVEHDARVWVCVHPGLLAPADLDRLVAAFEE